MMNMAFRHEIEGNKPIHPSSINARQLEVLETYCEKESIWRYGTASNYLRKLGLPSIQIEMLEFIEKAKAAMDIASEQ